MMLDVAALPAAAADAGGLFSGYQPWPGTYDEMCGPDGVVRAHWSYLAQALDALGPQELGQRWEEAHRLLRENGVTYNVYDETPSTARLWPLDPIPVLITSAEWSQIEHGLVQRAELLDLILADVYGPRSLLRRGVLPPELLYADPGFLRPCDGMQPAGRRWLSLYAADLVRAPDGGLRVIGDRTQAPSGWGYALENRSITSRIVPSLYRDSHVHRLSVFFRTLRTALAQLAPSGGDNPHVVLLTPGPDNEAYFEHVFLANHLGSTLVQGPDLTVRDGRVWLKTLDGLSPVDVIVRRLDDVYCDPLELRPDSLLGTPGLLQAVRLGHVALANPLGSGVVENPGLMAFLPAAARVLLGEELSLPSPATWWCGTADGCRYVVEHLGDLLIKSVDRRSSRSVCVGASLSTGQRADLVARIRAQPNLFVGQEALTPSMAPTVVSARLEPRPTVLRSFVVAGGGGYVVLPGGLSRVGPAADTRIVANQLGGLSKDVWVLASEPERDTPAIEPAVAPVRVTRAADDVPARVMDDLFWLGRYAERTEACARLLREVLLRLLASDRARPDPALPILLAAVTAHTATFPGFVGPDTPGALCQRLAHAEPEVRSVVLDRTRVGSLRFTIEALVRAGRGVRDQLSSDAVRVIQSLDAELRHPAEPHALVESLQRLIILLAAFAGICGESMSRGAGWRFLSVGRCLERALHGALLLRNVFIPGAGVPGTLEAALGVAHSLKTYRRRYRTRVDNAAVLDLLLMDETNPRSVASQLAHLESLAHALGGDEAPRRSRAERLALDALTQLRLFDVSVVNLPPAATRAPDGPAVPDGLHALDALLMRIGSLLATLSDELTTRYFRPPLGPQQLVRVA